MKYLKKFNESIEDKGYEKITLREFYEMVLGTKDYPISTSEIAAIGKIVSGEREMNWLDDESLDSTYIISQNINIYKKEDEWFYVKMYEYNDLNWDADDIFFKCDQFEGLIKLLKDQYTNGTKNLRKLSSKQMGYNHFLV